MLNWFDCVPKHAGYDANATYHVFGFFTVTWERNGLRMFWFLFDPSWFPSHRLAFCSCLRWWILNCGLSPIVHRSRNVLLHSIQEKFPGLYCQMVRRYIIVLGQNHDIHWQRFINCQVHQMILLHPDTSLRISWNGVSHRNITEFSDATLIQVNRHLCWTHNNAPDRITQIHFSLWDDPSPYVWHNQRWTV